MLDADNRTDATDRKDSGPRATLRVPEVLMAVAAQRTGITLADLSQQLSLPKSSLHRLLGTLEHGGYLLHRGGLYEAGPQAFRLASIINQAASAGEFPASARPVLEWLARETGETVMLSVLSEAATESIYIDVIESEALLRFTLRTGNRRPLYSVASGKVMLAFMPADAQARYLEQTEFLRFTPETTGRADMPEELERARQSGAILDRNGIVDGASAIASPVFDRQGRVFCAVSAAGPTERIETHRARIEALVRQAGERISQVVGLAGAYPPAR